MPAAQTSTAARAWRSGPSITVVDLIFAFVGMGWSLVWAVGLLPEGSETGRGSNPGVLWVYMSWVGLVAGSVVLVAVHELGHVVAASAMRLQVVGVRVWHLEFGRPARALAGTSGHVSAEVVDAGRWLPVRMVLFLLGGCTASVALALATAATVIANPSASIGLRASAVGFAVAGFCDAIANLAPRRLSRDVESDGRAMLRWIFHPTNTRAGMDVASSDVSHSAPPSPRGIPEQDRCSHLLSEMRNTRPEIAIAAITALFSYRYRWDDGWQDYDAVATFAAREDLPADVRARASSQYCLSLTHAHLVARRPPEPTHPDSPRLRQLEELAELALAANRASLQARTAMALVRITQMRPAEACGLLGDLDPTASPIVQARARAVLGIAEMELGNVDQARDLARASRQTTPTDPVVVLLHRMLAIKVSG